VRGRRGRGGLGWIRVHRKKEGEVSCGRGFEKKKVIKVVITVAGNVAIGVEKRQWVAYRSIMEKEGEMYVKKNHGIEERSAQA